MRSPKRTVTVSKEMDELIIKYAEKWNVNENEVMRRLLLRGAIISKALEDEFEVYCKKMDKDGKEWQGKLMFGIE